MAGNGDFDSLLLVTKNITEQKKLEIEYQRQLEKAMRSEKRANEAKTNLLRRMSHDLRTPINAILGMIEIADGKRCREAVPDRKQLAGEVSTGRKPKSLCQLIEGIHKQKIRKVQQKQFFHIHLCTLRSLTFTFSRSMVRCSVFSAACSFAWVSRSRMDGFSSRLIFRLANS